MKFLQTICLAALLGTAACQGDKPSGPSAGPTSDNTLAFASAPGGGNTEAADSLILRAQVALDRLGFSPRLIDGQDSRFYKLALTAFQEARNLPQTGRLDPDTQRALLAGQGAATRSVVIPAAFAQGPFRPDLPKDEAGQARFPHLSYRSMTEALAERFHTTPATLATLNGPNTPLGPGRTIRVPDVANVDPAKLDNDAGGDPRGWNQTLQLLGVAPDQPAADHIVVDKSAGTLRAYDEGGKLLAQFPVTTGSEHDPLPIGTWKVKGESRNPDYQFNPDLFWDASSNAKAKRLPPGPNGPVGVVWIDLSKEHYGIHGTPEPQNIGQTESHGCVRLTNWDAARLAQMVKSETKVVFQQ